MTEVRPQSIYGLLLFSQYFYLIGFIVFRMTIDGAGIPGTHHMLGDALNFSVAAGSFDQLRLKLEPLLRPMTARYTAPSICSRIIAERIPDGCIGSALKTGSIQADKMIGSQFSRIVAFGTE